MSTPSTGPTARHLRQAVRATAATSMSRRGLLGLGLGAGAALSLAACGGDAAGSASGTTTLKWAWQLPTTWDPVTSSAGSDVHMLALAYDSLTRLDDEGVAVPHLVDSWTYNDDGTELTLVLKPDLVFSDGAPIDATAVKASLERGRDADNSLVAPQLADLAEVAAPDAATVVLTLSAPNFQYPNLLAGKTGMVVNPKGFAAGPDALATEAAGSGPFVLDEYTQNANAKLSKNPRHLLADEFDVDAFELYPAADAATVVASLQSGQYNVALLPPSQVDAAKAAGLEVQVIDSLFVAVLDTNTAIPPFDDPAVVEALRFAINREELVSAGQFGIGEVNYQPFPPGQVGHNDELADVYAYDPDKARKILADAGYDKPIPLEVTTANPAGVPELVLQQLNDVGFDATIKTVPPAQFTEVVYIQHSEQLVVDGFAGREAPFQAFQVLYSDTGLMNPGREYDPKVKAAVEEFVRTPLDDPSYAEKLQAATKVAVETMPNTFLYTVPRVIARAATVSALPETTTLVTWNGVTVS